MKDESKESYRISPKMSRNSQYFVLETAAWRQWSSVTQDHIHPSTHRL